MHDSRRQHALALRQAGKSLRAIAAELAVPLTTLHRWLEQGAEHHMERTVERAEQRVEHSMEQPMERAELGAEHPSERAEHLARSSGTEQVERAAGVRHDSVTWCYEHLGWSFLPLAGKRPIQKQWQSRPRESLDEARQWAAAGNVGLRTGQASGGVAVIDVDADGDVEDLALPLTVTAVTGSGGRHYYFATPQPIRNSVSKLCEHVDVRGDGGQVVFPGSIHPDTGLPYHWLDHHEPWTVPLAPLPQQVLDALEKVTAPPAPRQQPKRPSSRRHKGRRLAQFILRSETQAVAEAGEGTRNDTLNKAAFCLGRLIGGGNLDQADVEHALREAARQAGLTGAEVDRTIESGIAAGIADPRDLSQEQDAVEPERRAHAPSQLAASAAAFGAGEGAEEALNPSSALRCAGR